MAHPLELAEPNVIDEELIRSSISTVEEIAIGEDKKREMKTETALHQVRALGFSFQNILKIDNLTGLHALVKLQLDNNIIERIENIGHLTNLEWLDLSFNNISKIEGIETLIKLTDLSLFNNRIDKLKGLDQLTDLNCLSIGNNQISSNDLLGCLQYLRPFANLRILSMQGNPCSRDPDYYTRVIAHLSDLVYVDYRLVDPEKVLLAKEQWQDELYEEQEKEARRADEAAQNAAAAQKLAELRDANLEGCDTLLKDMLDDDPEQGRLKMLSFWDEVVDEIQNDFKELQETFITNTLDKNGTLTKKADEYAKFVAALHAKRAEIDSQSILLVQRFESKKKKLLRQLDEDNMPEEEAIQKLNELLDANMVLNDDLLELELRQMDADDAIMSEFEHKYEVQVKSFIDSAQQEFFGKVRELENAFFEKCITFTQTELDDFAAGKLDDISEDARMFLSDKDVVMTAWGQSHDSHLGKIDGLEDKICTKERTDAKAIFSKFRNGSNERDRNRITEIGKLVAQNRDSIQKLILEEEMEAGR